jgi:hypothetical protein
LSQSTTRPWRSAKGGHSHSAFFGRLTVRFRCQREGWRSVVLPILIQSVQLRLSTGEEKPGQGYRFCLRPGLAAAGPDP